MTMKMKMKLNVSPKLRGISLGLILTVALAGITGCSGNTATSSIGGTAGTTPASSSGNGSTFETIDPEQPDRIAEVYGKVKSIQGNVVIIAEMQRQESNANLTDEEKAQRRDQMQALSEEERQKLQSSQEVITGKNLTLMIPVGIPVKVRTTGSTDGPTLREGTIASIKPGNVINIWTDAADPTTAEYVSISNR